MFDELLDEILNEPTIPDIINHGKCIRKKNYIDENGDKVEAAAYKYNSETYISLCVNEQCVMFDNIKNVRKKLGKE